MAGMSLRLTYFNVRALGEPIRYILSFRGIHFEDVRLAAEWPAFKEDAPFGKLPTLRLEDGELVHQSAAICRYLATGTELAGTSARECLRIDQAVGAVNDLTAAVGQMFNFPEPDVKKRLKQSLETETLPYYLERFDRLLSENGGYLANSKLSWGDLYLVGYSESLPVIFDPVDPIAGHPHLAALRVRVQALEGIRQWLAVRPVGLL